MVEYLGKDDNKGALNDECGDPMQSCVVFWSEIAVVLEKMRCFRKMV